MSIDIFNRLTRRQLMYGLKDISEDRYWLSLKTIGFKDLSYLVEGVSVSHKSIFIDRILEVLELGDNLLDLVPQYIVMCFNYRETFELIISEWAKIPVYLSSIILEVVDGKRLLMISELCSIEEWGRLCSGMSGYLRDELEDEIVKLEILEINSIESVNLIYFCRTFSRFSGLHHIFSLLKDSRDREGD